MIKYLSCRIVLNKMINIRFILDWLTILSCTDELFMCQYFCLYKNKNGDRMLDNLFTHCENIVIGKLLTI